MRNKKGQFIKGIKYQLGYKHTDKTKIKIKEARTRQGSNVWNKGKIGMPWSGKSRTIKTRKKIGDAQKGNKNHNWKGGITPLRIKIRQGIAWQLWKENVYQRDNFTCKKCEQYGGKLSAHHIEDFAHNELLRFEIDNGITLCRDYHRKFHKIYGNKRGNTLEQLTEFLWRKS